MCGIPHLPVSIWSRGCVAMPVASFTPLGLGLAIVEGSNVIVDTIVGNGDVMGSRV